MEQHIKDVILRKAESVLGIQIEENQLQFQRTRRDVAGDLTLVVFPFVKALRCSPAEAGEKIGALLKSELEEIASYEVIQGFLNLSFTDKYWVNVLKTIDAAPKYGFAAADSKPTIMVEYASPNTNKPLHLGHLRNIFLGYSVAQILKANGHKVVKTQIINDRGIHICKSMLAWQKFSPLNEKGERETPQNTGMKGDKLVGKYYVEFDKAFNAEAKAIIENWSQGNFAGYDEKVCEEYQRLSASKAGKDEKAMKGLDEKIKDLAKNQTSILREAKDMLISWEAKHPEVYLLWSTMNGWVYEGFAATYAQMEVDFDSVYYESDTYLLGKDLVMEGLESGVFYRKEDGSVWIDLSDEGLDEKLVLRSDGTAVYMTQDVGTAVDRYNNHPDLQAIIYTVGNEQDYHFKVLFLILKKLGYAWAENCYHLSYGMVELPEGKMKSREGTVVDADELMAEVVQEARKMTEERGHIEGMSPGERKALYNLIGMGGLKYYLLKVDPKKGMLFKPDESIEMNGNTGPFIQYAHARIKSLLSKTGNADSTNATSLVREEREVIKHLHEFPAVLNEAAQQYSPALIVNYSYDLVKLYNQFYQDKNLSVLNEEDAELRNLRILMSRNVARVIANAMGLLGVRVPERM
jgi:arginyl-tRNA synthetase